MQAEWNIRTSTVLLGVQGLSSIGSDVSELMALQKAQHTRWMRLEPLLLGVQNGNEGLEASMVAKGTTANRLFVA